MGVPLFRVPYGFRTLSESKDSEGYVVPVAPRRELVSVLSASRTIVKVPRKALLPSGDPCFRTLSESNDSEGIGMSEYVDGLIMFPYSQRVER